jgi:HSP20 family protein
MSDTLTVNDLINSVLTSRGHHHGQPTRHMAVDMYEHDDTYVVQADLPGYPKENIDVTIENGVLSVEAARGSRPDEKDKDKDKDKDSASKPTYYHRERTSGKVARAFRLPVNAAKDQAEVTFVDGVLTVTIPKEANSGVKKLSIA